jgi:methylated-DNA-protein-cysteine methyltransferase-like protein
MSSPVNSKTAIYTALKSVPAGKLVTYGQLADMAGLPRAARLVGTVLCQLPEVSDLPWHRVVNAQGRISMPEGSAGYREQLRRLEAEGIEVKQGKIRLKDYLFQGF